MQPRMAERLQKSTHNNQSLTANQ